MHNTKSSNRLLGNDGRSRDFNLALNKRAPLTALKRRNFYNTPTLYKHLIKFIQLLEKINDYYVNFLKNSEFVIQEKRESENIAEKNIQNTVRRLWPWMH